MANDKRRELTGRKSGALGLFYVGKRWLREQHKARQDNFDSFDPFDDFDTATPFNPFR